MAIGCGANTGSPKNPDGAGAAATIDKILTAINYIRISYENMINLRFKRQKQLTNFTIILNFDLFLQSHRTFFITEPTN